MNRETWPPFYCLLWYQIRYWDQATRRPFSGAYALIHKKGYPSINDQQIQAGHIHICGFFPKFLLSQKKKTSWGAMAGSQLHYFTNRVVVHFTYDAPKRAIVY